MASNLGYPELGFQGSPPPKPRKKKKKACCGSCAHAAASGKPGHCESSKPAEVNPYGSASLARTQSTAQLAGQNMIFGSPSMPHQQSYDMLPQPM